MRGRPLEGEPVRRRFACDNRPMPADLGTILTAMVTPFDAHGAVDE
jgi:hypothetical protein